MDGWTGQGDNLPGGLWCFIFSDGEYNQSQTVLVIENSHSLHSRPPPHCLRRRWEVPTNHTKNGRQREALCRRTQGTAFVLTRQRYYPVGREGRGARCRGPDQILSGRRRCPRSNRVILEAILAPSSPSRRPRNTHHQAQLPPLAHQRTLSPIKRFLS